jgi:Fe-Mn family superoxide dismutase
MYNDLIHNYGCNINHELFWENLSPISEGGGVLPTSDSGLGVAIHEAFGSFDAFIS